MYKRDLESEKGVKGMRILLLPMMALILAVGLAIPMAATPVASAPGLITLKSDNAECAGYFNGTAPADPLDASIYTGGGKWSPAVAVNPPLYAWAELDGAVWVSSAEQTEGSNGDQFRLFREEFHFPPGR